MPESCCPAAAAMLEGAEPDALAYLDLPQSRWKRLRTDNVQERTNRETKRRSRVVQVFPSAASLERLAGVNITRREHRPFRGSRNCAHAVWESPVSQTRIATSSQQAICGR